MKKRKFTRRELLKSSAVTAGALMLSGAAVPLVEARGSDTIRVGLVGCGGRGSALSRSMAIFLTCRREVASGNVHGPLSEDEFNKLRTKLKVPAEISFKTIQ